MPLREITPVRQEPGEAPRRWFAGDDLELIVWTDEDGGVRRFQLAYDRERGERLVQWTPAGITLHRVDTGEVHPLQPKATPILLPDPGEPPTDLAERLDSAAERLEPGIRDPVLAVLRGMKKRGAAG